MLLFKVRRWENMSKNKLTMQKQQWTKEEQLALIRTFNHAQESALKALTEPVILAQKKLFEAISPLSLIKSIDSTLEKQVKFFKILVKLLCLSQSTLTLHTFSR